MWLFMILLMAGKIGRKLGIQYLFLDPEYQGDVGFLSFFFVGLAYASFLMSWNLTVYLLSARYFPFLASLSRPFREAKNGSEIAREKSQVQDLGVPVLFPVLS